MIFLRNFHLYRTWLKGWINSRSFSTWLCIRLRKPYRASFRLHTLPGKKIPGDQSNFSITFGISIFVCLVLCQMSTFAEDGYYGDEVEQIFPNIEGGTLKIDKKFLYEKKPYIELSDGSFWEIPTVKIQAREHWWNSEVYGDPTERWMRFDEIELRRATEGDYPVTLVNLSIGEEAPTLQVNFTLLLEQKTDQRFEEMGTKMDKLRRSLHSSRRHLDRAEYAVRNLGEEIKRLEGRTSFLEREVEELSISRGSSR